MNSEEQCLTGDVQLGNSQAVALRHSTEIGAG